MTQRDQIHKWLVYALGLVPVWLLDACILPRYPLWGTAPMLLPLAAAAVSVLEGAYAGTGFGRGVAHRADRPETGGNRGRVYAHALPPRDRPAALMNSIRAIRSRSSRPSAPAAQMKQPGKDWLRAYWDTAPMAIPARAM